MKPIVSILIPAYNAEPWIADTIKTALAQTWPRTEIIVVDDGSRDQTLSIARQFASKNISVVTQENQGAAAARIWCDLSPVEWLIRKMGQNLHMPPATWLVSRELTQAAGPWDTRLSLDDDGEYFCRVILASDAIRFVPDAKVFYRASSSDSLSSIDESEKKLISQFLSMQLHVSYVRSLEESERVRAACLNYLQTRFIRFYPERVALVKQLEQLAAILGGRLEVPQLSWKYSWMRKVFGWTVTKRIRQYYNRWKSSVTRSWDKAFFHLERQNVASRAGSWSMKSAV